MRTLGTALKKRREELGINQEKAGEHFDVSRQAYRMWELDARVTLDSDFLAEVADFLGTDERGALIAIGWLPADDGDTGMGSVGDSPRHATIVQFPTQTATGTQLSLAGSGDNRVPEAAAS